MASRHSVLYAFVDLKDPFLLTGIEGESAPGPVLSIMGRQEFGRVFLFYTPQTAGNARMTKDEAESRHPGCRVELRWLPVSDPKDYSRLMGALAQQIRMIEDEWEGGENYICVSSGTAEMRAAWFLLNASGMLPGRLLQVGSPAQPLFGEANVKEVDLEGGEWDVLRDLVMPQEFFESRIEKKVLFRLPARPEAPAAELAAAAPTSELEAALNELGLFVGSAKLRLEVERAAVAAGVDAPVLITGETGTGKELFARLVHRLSARAGRPLVAVNCATLHDLAESKLFGHVKGAFTGAVADAVGCFDQADGGTLFLDEIGELPLEAQAKLLRALQQREVQPLGSKKPHKVDARIIAATNRDLQAEVKAGRFREDLYYRIEVVQLRLPPLRERREEIPHLALAILRQLNAQRDRETQISKKALRRLEEHAWPGNVRELENVMRRSVLYAPEDVLHPEDLLITEPCESGADPLAALPDPVEGFSLEDFLAKARRQLMLRALAKCGGNQSRAAALLGVSKQAVSKFVQGCQDNPF
jgi:DNA-binding NtrC family response regulator